VGYGPVETIKGSAPKYKDLLGEGVVFYWYIFAGLFFLNY
jgi:hypothetical protein